jgi:hypothetical protein
VAINKQSLNINFAQGLDTKTDPFQVAPGKFLALQNTVFDKGGLLQKRNGFSTLGSLPDNTSKYLTTFNGNLTAIGSSLKAYSTSSQTWVDKGNIQPVELETLPLIRSNTNQSQGDSAIASNGLVCTVYVDNVPNNSGENVAVTKYVIADSVTGQNITAPAPIPVASGTVTGSARVLLLGKYFMILFTNNISGTNHLQYVAVNTNIPSQVSVNTDISTTYAPSSSVSFDAVLVNNSLYIAWNGSDIGNAVRMTYIDSTLVQHNTAIFAGHAASIISITPDLTQGTPSIYVSFYSSGSTNGYTFAVNQQLNVIFAQQAIITGESVANITSVAQNNLLTVFYEVNNNYGYDATISTHLIKKRTVTNMGVVGTASVLKRSVGIASKAFIINSTIYLLTAYQSAYQPTYFLIDSVGNIIAKVAYSNGGGYVLTGLPQVVVNGSSASVAYLVKDLVQATNKTQAAANSAPVYSQTGINLVTFDITTSSLITTEIGNNLNLTGGFLWAYDGYTPVEQGFHLWPDSVEVSTATTSVGPTGTLASGSPIVTNLTSMTNIHIGDSITGADVPANTYVISIDVANTSLTMSNAATGTGPEVLTIRGNLSAQQYFYQVTYEWADNQGNVFRSAPSIPVGIVAGGANSTNTLNIPTLRLTYKIANPVKIVVYRWSAAQETYFQVTSIQMPILNDPTVDSITYFDTQSDAQILGNNILYTTGGVLENIAAPAISTLTSFQSRLFGVSSEDRNLLVYSKQVIETVPVEMSDLLTVFVPPSTGAQGSTGPIRCLAPLDDKLIIFKDNALIYINGTGPDNTGANSQFSEPTFITSTVGCANQKSIVFMPSGLMFQSDKGIWLLGRDLSTTYIGAPVEEFTQDSIVQSAVNVPGTNQVRFTMDSGITLVYDYYYGQWSTFVNIPAISSTLFQGLHTYINSLAQAFQESPGSYLDGSNPVLMSFTTSWLNLAGLQGFERAYYFYMLGTYISPHKLNVQIAYDYSPAYSQSVMIAPDNFNPAWGGDSLWGGSSPWGGNLATEQWRVFFSQQKCQAFQVTMTESYDPSFGTVAGAGLTISGLDMVVGVKGSYPRLKASRSVG